MSSNAFPSNQYMKQSPFSLVARSSCSTEKTCLSMWWGNSMAVSPATKVQIFENVLKCVMNAKN